MKKILFILLLMVPVMSIAQDSTKHKPPPEIWTPSTTWRASPVPDGVPELPPGQTSKYDTVPCKYKFVGDTTVHVGWKVFYRKNGYWMDDKTTIQLFFNLHYRRLDYVSSYAIMGSYRIIQR